MITSIKSEFLKLLTVRSTYIISIIALIIIAILAFYFEGYRGVAGTGASNLAPTAIKEIVAFSSGTVGLFVAIISILLMAHEFRYNTITYSLTLSKSRTKFLLSKTIASAIFALAFGFIMVSFAVACYYLGLNLRNASLPAQDINVLTLAGKAALYFVAYSLFGLILASIIRNLVATIAFFFIVPNTVEPLLSIILKDNTAYLPVTLFDSIVGAGIIDSELSATRIVTFSIMYLAIGWLVAWYLFLKRDTN